MRTIFNIARAEIKILFYSPIAWLLSIIFLLQCGLEYTGNLQIYLTEQDLGGIRLMNLQSLTRFVIVSDGLFNIILTKVYLYIPLLTMGLISRELGSGTIKLLFSSPIKIRQIILGKYLAMMAYNLLLIVIAGIFVVSGEYHIQFAETGTMLTALLGLYLLFCAYAAIGLFMSCLTSYQVVAAISTLAVFAFLEYIGSLWQGVDIIRDLTYFLSISSRTRYFMTGLIRTQDLLYFLIIISLFVSFSIAKLQFDREKKSRFNMILRYVSLLCAALVAGYLTALPGFSAYLDSTSDKEMTLTPNSQQIIKAMNSGPLQVTSYINLLDIGYFLGDPSERNSFLRKWEPYLRFKPDIKFKYVYYYDSVSVDQHLFEYNPGKNMAQIVDQYLKTYNQDIKDFKSPKEIRKLIDLKAEENRFVMQLQYQGKKTFLRLYNDAGRFPSETETDAALKRLLTKLPKIVFLTGEGERSIENIKDQDYQSLTSDRTFRYALVNQGFDVETISLKSHQIPSDISALVIADPKISFSPEVLSKLQAYIKQGGNLLIATEPGKDKVVQPLLAQMNVTIMDGKFAQKSDKYAPDVVLPLLTGYGSKLYSLLKKPYHDSIPISMPGAAGLSGDSGSYLIKALLTTDNRFAMNLTHWSAGDTASLNFSATSPGNLPIATALALTRQVNGNEQRIVITGDADFLSNAELKRTRTANFSFATAIFGWFTYGKFPVDTTRPGTKDNRLTITDAGLSKMKLFYLGILPGAFALLGAGFLIRRKRK